jgi:hypothetical protein
VAYGGGRRASRRARHFAPTLASSAVRAPARIRTRPAPLPIPMASSSAMAVDAPRAPKLDVDAYLTGAAKSHPALAPAFERFRDLHRRKCVPPLRARPPR